MKKYIIFLLLACLLLFSGCSNKGASESSEAPGSQTTESISETEAPESENAGQQDTSSEAEGNSPGISSTDSSSSDKPSSVGESTSQSKSPTGSTSSQTPGQSTPAQNSNSSPAQPPTVIAVTGVSLNKSSVTLEIGETAQLTAAVSPSGAANKTVTWSSGNTGVATVSSNGLVTAKSAGSATITVTSNNGKTASCTVTVNSPKQPFDPEPYAKYARQYGEGIGLIWLNDLNGGAWNSPVNLYDGLSEETMKKSIRSSCDIVKREGFEYFKIVVKPLADGSYQLYVYYS